MATPRTIEPKAGQTVILYDNGKVLFKKSYTSDSRIYTAWDSFFGTTQEVEDKIKELNLKDLSPLKSPSFGTAPNDANQLSQ